MDMLKAILDIEKKAQKIAGTFEASVLSEKKKTERLLTELEEREKLNAGEALSVIRERFEKELKEKLEENSLMMAEKTAAMEKDFLKNEKHRINEITKKITGGDAV